MRAALGRVDLFFAHGPAATAYVRALGCPPQRLLAGTSAIDGVGSRPLPGLPVPRIVSTGRLAPDKAPDVLVEAIALMRRPPPVFMLGEGRMRARLERRIAALGLEEVIHLPGWTRGPGRWVAGASALALPSREEAWSQSAVFAMALGTPVVGTSVEALPEVLDRGRGILVPPEDPEALARALEDVLAGRRSTDRAAARAYAAQFTPARVAARYAAHYRQLAEAARRPTTIPRPAPQPHRSKS